MDRCEHPFLFQVWKLSIMCDPAFMVDPSGWYDYFRLKFVEYGIREFESMLMAPPKRRYWIPTEGIHWGKRNFNKSAGFARDFPLGLSEKGHLDALEKRHTCICIACSHSRMPLVCICARRYCEIKACKGIVRHSKESFNVHEHERGRQGHRQ
jgi:hypothetical protein